MCVWMISYVCDRFVFLDIAFMARGLLVPPVECDLPSCESCSDTCVGILGHLGLVSVLRRLGVEGADKHCQAIMNAEPQHESSEPLVQISTSPSLTAATLRAHDKKHAKQARTYPPVPVLPTKQYSDADASDQASAVMSVASSSSRGRGRPTVAERSSLPKLKD